MGRAQYFRDLDLLASILHQSSRQVFLGHQPFARRAPNQAAISPLSKSYRRAFATSTSRKTIRPLSDLPPRTASRVKDSNGSDLLSLQWTRPPVNVLLVKKDCSTVATDALVEFAKSVAFLKEGAHLTASSHVKSEYPSVNILLESTVSLEVNEQVNFDVFSASSDEVPKATLNHKVDLITTFGGDGTILHASSLFAASAHVPPILSFSMGTLGFLGEWKFIEFKRAFREVFMSGSQSDRSSIIDSSSTSRTNFGPTGWSSIRGKALGTSRAAQILIRNRLKVGVFDSTGQRLSTDDNSFSSAEAGDIHAMNEVIIHRGKDPHLAIISIFIGGRFLTEAVADGMIIATPTGSTAYSLSSGGSIVHPLVPSIMLTPICPRSLSFRPLVLPANTPVTLRLSEKNRGREMEVSIDGVNRRQGIGVGAELRVSGEQMIHTEDGYVQGGIPCIMRRHGKGTDGDDGWVGGLNGLLKFNYPFGEEN